MLSSRGGLDPKNLEAYLNRVRTSPFTQRDNILWDSFKHEEISIAKNKEFRGLQVADCVASAIFKAVEVSAYGTVEPRYINDLRPLFERHPYQAYQAVTYWPSVPLNMYDERMSWLSR